MVVACFLPGFLFFFPPFVFETVTLVKGPCRSTSFPPGFCCFPALRFFLSWRLPINCLGCFFPCSLLCFPPFERPPLQPPDTVQLPFFFFLIPLSFSPCKLAFTTWMGGSFVSFSRFFFFFLNMALQVAFGNATYHCRLLSWPPPRLAFAPPFSHRFIPPRHFMGRKPFSPPLVLSLFLPLFFLSCRSPSTNIGPNTFIPSSFSRSFTPYLKETLPSQWIRFFKSFFFPWSGIFD